jgi:flagellar protein FlaJ
MKFIIPFTFSRIEALKKRSKPFLKLTSRKKNKFDEYLKSIGSNLSSSEYKSICIRNFVINFTILIFLATLILFLLKMKFYYLFGPGFALLASGFLFFIQINYPKIISLNKTREIDKNLIAALQDVLVQLNSGVPLFSIMVNISQSDYGGVSDEFKRIVMEINSGESSINAIEKYAKLNSSEYFRRSLWQISNGMRSGSDMASVVKESIRNLNEEQTIQIQSYGNKLNPLIMFYMLIAVILPSLGITFLIILSSMMGLSELLVKGILIGTGIFIVLMQIMFLGVIKSKRPRLI